jgi:hypothetical protein
MMAEEIVTFVSSSHLQLCATGEYTNDISPAKKKTML